MPAPRPEETPREASGKRRWFTFSLLAVAVFVGGIATGLALPADTTGLDATHAELRRTQSRLAELELTLAAAREDNAALTGSIEQANATSTTAQRRAEAAERRLETREASLDERSEALDAREQALEEREQELDEREPVVDEADDVAAPPAELPASASFDRAWAVDIASDIVRDVRTVDHRLGDGIAVDSALSLLSGDYPRLLDAGIPPGVDEADYRARLRTLESFADEAANLYPSDPTGASAQYAVVREETAVLLEELNAAIDTDFRLP